jgi:MFS family permease
MSDSITTQNVSNNPGLPAGSASIHAHRLLWAGFMAILAEGVGFAVRGGILGQWAQQYGFTMTELGQITGGGLTGFGVIIILSSLVADKVGYGALMVSAFALHFLSAVVTLGAGWAFAHGGRISALHCLSAGMFLFAMGNGLCEGVANPLVAALFQKDKSKYLNILHAGWPGGLILGALASYFMAGGDGGQPVAWQIQMSLFLIPVALYGIMLFGQKFPKSEASVHKVKFTDMLKELGFFGALIICFFLALWLQDICGALGLPTAVGWAGGAVLVLAFGFSTKFSPGYFLMVLMLILHSIQGYVELGTDSWVSKITGNFLHSEKNGLLVFAYINGLMFALRFFAGPIVHKISSLGLLFVSAILGSVGLLMLGHSEAAWFCVIAASVYAVGKTFCWPTLLAVVSEQFPKGGAITIGAMGACGTLCAGLMGGPGIGFNQDSHTTAKLQAENPAVFERYKASSEATFMVIFKTTALDGAKVGILENNGKDIDTDPNLAGLKTWWDTAKPTAATDAPIVNDAILHGAKAALNITSILPGVQAFILLCILLYFKSKGGYKQVHIEGQGHAAKEVA